MPDCGGTITSLGHNILGDASGCSVTLAPTDRMGDAGLATLRHHVIPLLRESAAIDAGDDSACPPRDQLGVRRRDGDRDGIIVCDIGAVEFRPGRHRR